MLTVYWRSNELDRNTKVALLNEKEAQINMDLSNVLLWLRPPCNDRDKKGAQIYEPDEFFSIQQAGRPEVM